MSKKAVETIKSLEFFEQVISTRVPFVLPNGQELEFIVHALTGKQATALENARKATKPQAPEPPRNSQGEINENLGVYKEQKKNHEDALSEWQVKESIWYMLEGWAKPNDIELQGKDDAERVDLLFASKMPAGYPQKIANAIIKISNLSLGDTDFFTGSSAQRS